jgi:ABC-2 type transport system ATP-binding protein
VSASSIVVRDLVRTFKRRGQPDVRAVDGVTFSVRRGSIFGLLGPNGAGKTTTLKMLTTLLRPTSGEIAVEGFDPIRDPLEVRRRISVVIQESAAELFLSVVDNFATFGRFHGLSRDTIRARTEDVLDVFELRPEAHRKVMDLSGGFKRRVQVAKVFMIDSPVVFLDEFSTGMDPILKRSVMARLRQEAARGRTIVLTTQILSEAEDLCDDILILKSGKQAARGDIHTLKLLSGGLFEIAVTFAEAPGELAKAVAAYRPLRVEVSQNTALITVRGGESSVLDLVAHLGRLGRVLRLEVSGASLEDIFIELTAAEGQEVS